MIIGLLWCLCAYLCISKRDRTNRRLEQKGIILGIFFGFFGICGVIGGILKSTLLLATSTLLPVAILCIAVFVLALYNLAKCKTQIPATYLAFNTYTGNKGYRSYSPVFRYYFRGVTYERQVAENYSMNALNKRFVQGQTYTIWINENAPETCITRKRVMGIQVLCLIIGVFMLIVYGICALAAVASMLGYS